MPLTIIDGIPGSGKDAFFVDLMYKKNRNNLEINSNSWLDFPKYVPLHLVDLLYLKGPRCIFMNEAYNWLESRHSGKYMNVFLSHVNFQLRKTLMQIFATIQMTSSLDKRYRKMYDYRIHCERLPNDCHDWHFHDFHYIKKDNRQKRLSQKFYTYEELEYTFELFNTYEIIMTPARSRIEFDILKTEPALLLKRGVLIYDKIKSDFLDFKITKDFMKVCLLHNDFDPIWGDLLYLIVNNYHSILKWIKLKNNVSRTK